MAENTCTGECLKCPFPQQVYCAAQRTYAILKNQEAIVARLDQIAERLNRVDGLLAKFDVKEVIPLEDNAQKDSGAENRGSKK